MNNYKKVINDFLNLFQLGILTAKDIKQEISNIIQFKKEKIMNHFNNYTQEDLKELKKKINKLNLEIESLKKKIKNYDIYPSKQNWMIQLVVN